ncbi:MAG: hypothetical protein JST12_18875 [Armatimonadetes bacterium]|nr:hypothetical protein [Armatimonadota bacterium]
MIKCFLVAGLLALPGIGLCQASKPHGGDWWDRELWSRLSYSGSRTFGYQSYTFRGDADAFDSLTNYGTGLKHFTDIGNLSLQGQKVFGLLDFRATFTDNRFSDPEQQQYTLNYKKGFWDLSYGTVQASLINGNRFANFSRSLNGFVGDFKKGKLETKVLASEARGAARTVTVEGNNTPGPYYLQGGRIIGGTIRVLVDGIELQQGVDYLADTNVGSITFINRVIAPTSTIVASYESYDVTHSGGSIRGAGLSYNLGQAGRIGLTTVEQRVGDANATGERIESFQGFGLPGDQYPLLFEPIPTSISVTVDGVIRTFSITDDGVSEFYLSANVSNVVISRVAVTNSQTLQIRYIPKNVQTVDGNRKVTGFDWRLPIGDNGSGSYLAYSNASGRLSGANSSSGNAEGIDMKLNTGKGSLKVGFRKIDPGFKTIEQTGFGRNEDVSEYAFDYATKGFSSTLSTGNSLISIDNGGTETATRYMTSNLAFRYTDPKRESTENIRSQSLTFGRSRATSTDDNTLSSVSLKDDFRSRKFSFGYGVEKLTGHGRIDGELSGVAVDSYRTNASYGIGRNWNLVASASKSFIRTDAASSQGYDYSLRANMAQTGPWSGGVGYTLSDSGVLASLGGFLNGSSLGYGSGGFSGGGTGVISTGRQQARQFNINATHQAGENLSVGLSYAATTTQGASTSNATIDTLSLDTSWRVNSAHTLVLSLVKVKSDFLTSSVGTSDSDILSALFIGTPGRQWSYTFGYNSLKSGGTTLGQNNLGANADISYHINRKQRVFISSSISRTRGLYPQNDTSFQTGYAYSIVDGISLVGRYNFRNLQNLDPGAVGGAFRANGVSLELTFDLSNRR